MTRLLIASLTSIFLLALAGNVAAADFAWQDKAKLKWQSTYISGDGPGTNQVIPQIAGGTPVADGVYPYAVRLEAKAASNRPHQAFCSGALIAPRYVLTAAHCIAFSELEYNSNLRFNQLRVRFANVSGDPAVAVARVAYWKNFDFVASGSVAQSDVAILQLAADAPASPAQLSALSPEMAAAPLRELGYGPRLKSEGDGMRLNLIEGLMQEADPLVCSGTVEGVRFRVFADAEICTKANPPEYNAGACHGDSGGPLTATTNGAIVGVGSWSKVQNCDVDAAQRQTVFARVSAAQSWLANQTGAALFGAPAVTRNITAPGSPRIRISKFTSKGVTIRFTASGAWQNNALVVLSGVSKGREYEAVATGKFSNSDNQARLKFSSAWQKKKMSKMEVGVYARFYNSIDNGSTAPIATKTWRR